MFRIIALSIGGLYLLSLITQLVLFALRWRRAARSAGIRFRLTLAADPVADGTIYSLSVVPEFYEEKNRAFTFAFSLLGFSIMFIPKETMEPLVREFGAGKECRQIMCDSNNLISGGTPPVVCTWDTRGTGFSGGADVLYMTGTTPDKSAEDELIRSAASKRIPQEIAKLTRSLIKPEVTILKDSNKWLFAFDSGDRRDEFLRLLLTRFGEKVLRKHAIEGKLLEPKSDPADQFVSRGQVSWWMEGDVEGDTIVFSGEGIRPGEATSADLMLFSIPFERRV